MMSHADGSGDQQHAGKVTDTSRATYFRRWTLRSSKASTCSEGERVKKGQMLATLDPTFAAADVKQLKAQIASLKRRSRATGGTRPQASRFSADSRSRQAKYDKLADRALYDQHMAQYKAQLNSFDQKIGSHRGDIQKYKMTWARTRARGHRQASRRHARTMLLHGTGSLLNQLTSQGRAAGTAAHDREFDHNSLKESEAQLASLQADREAFMQQWSTTVSQDLVTARNTLDGARRQLEKAHEASGPGPDWRRRRLHRVDDGQAVGRVGAERRRRLFTLMPIGFPWRPKFRCPRATSASCAPGTPPRSSSTPSISPNMARPKGKVSGSAKAPSRHDDNGQRPCPPTTRRGSRSRRPI